MVGVADSEYMEVDVMIVDAAARLNKDQRLVGFPTQDGTIFIAPAYVVQLRATPSEEVQDR